MSAPQKHAVTTALQRFFAGDAHDAVAAYVYGSVARGTAGVSSDIDVAVLFAADPPPTLDGLSLRLEGALEKLLGRRVQLVTLNHAAPDLVHRVLRDGELVFEGDRSRRILFEVAARNRYFDLLPFLRRYRKPPAA